MERLRNNKHFVTIVCLVLGAVLLCSAAVANVGNAGGYTTYKQGLIGLLGMDDYSGHGYVSLMVDDTEVVRMDYTEMLNRNAAVGKAAMYSSTSGSIDIRGLIDGWQEWRVVNPEDHITECRYTSYTYHGKDDAWALSSTDFTGAAFGGLVDFDASNEHNAKLLRIAELIVDTFVGELKNNFVYLGSKDGLKEYRISLSGNQLPEIVSAVLSLLGSDSATYSVFAGERSVMTAVGFDFDLDGEDGWEDYNSARSKAWDVLADHDDSGVAIINSDLSIDWYPSAKDYFLTLGRLDPVQLISDTDLEKLFLAMKGEPEVESASCDLWVDGDGRLMENTLSGTLDFRLVDNSWHSATLTIHGKFDSRDANVQIPLPEVDPMAASIVDSSLACAANDYLTTVHSYGKVETYKNAPALVDTSTTYYIDRFLELDPFSKLNNIDVYAVYVHPAYAASAGEKIVIYDGEWVERSEFDEMCAELFGNEYYIREFAEKLGVAPYALSRELLWAYRQLTGDEWAGELYDFTHVSSTTAPENEYLFNYTPVDRILALAERCGYQPNLRYSSEGIPADTVFYKVPTRAYSGEAYGYATIYVTADELSEAMSVIQRAADADELPYLEEYNLYPDELIKIANDAYWNSLTSAMASDGVSSSLAAIGGADGPTKIFVSPLG